MAAVDAVFLISRWTVCFGFCCRGRQKIWCIEIILPSNADQREQSISTGIGQRRAHAVRGGRVSDGADRPIRGDPFSRGMRQNRAEPNDASGFIDRGGLYCGDLMLAQGLAHDIESARERRIAEGSLCCVK